jgi:hypothetical protein
LPVIERRLAWVAAITVALIVGAVVAVRFLH